MKTHTKNWLGFAGVCLMFGAMLWGILAIQSSEIREFRRDGVAANATVISTYEQSSRSSSTGSSSIEHIMTVTYMDRSDVEESDVSVDLLSGEFEMPEINIGDFQRAEFNINRSSFEEISEGDSVKILFLPNDPSEARLAGEIENWQPTFLNISIGVTIAGALICIFIAFFKHPKSTSSEFENLEYFEEPLV